MILHNSKFDLELDRLQWAQDNKHICIIPYIETQIRSDHINPCCFYTQETNTMDVENLDQRIITVKNNIESGRIDKNCHVCHNEETNGQLSSRVRQILQHTSQEILEVLTTKQTREFTDFIIFSNKCNMACRMCSGDNSSLYASIWANKKDTSVNLSSDDVVWSAIKAKIKYNIENAKDVYRIVVMGGEGTIQEDLYKLTDWLIDEKLSNRVNLQIATNGSVCQDETFNYWCKNFKQLTFGVSVDSANADNFPYVRYPAKFEKISKNLQSFKELTAQYQNFNFYITPTFYINNIAYLEDFLDYFEEFDCDTKCLAIRDNTLSQPEYLKLSNLPNYIKTQLVDQIIAYINNYSLLERNPMFKISINSMLDQLRITDFSTEHWERYLDTSARWDRLTGTDIAVNNKRLWDLFSDSDKALYHQYRSKYDNINH